MPLGPIHLFFGKDGDFPASDLLVETGGWLPTTVRIWVGDYGMLKPPRSCCCRSFGAVDLGFRGFSGFWGWYVAAVDLQCQKSKSKKIGRKTHPKDITVHAWMLLWFVWIDIFWGLGFSGIFPQDIFFPAREICFLTDRRRDIPGRSMVTQLQELSMNFRQWFDIRMMFPFAFISPGRESIYIYIWYI